MGCLKMNRLKHEICTNTASVLPDDNEGIFRGLYIKEICNIYYKLNRPRFVIKFRRYNKWEN